MKNMWGLSQRSQSEASIDDTKFPVGGIFLKTRGYIPSGPKKATSNSEYRSGTSRGDLCNRGVRAPEVDLGSGSFGMISFGFKASEASE